MQLIIQRMTLILAVAFSCVSLLVSPTWVTATHRNPVSLRNRVSGSSPVASSKKQSVRLVLPPLPIGNPPGGRRYGGARRSGCPEVAVRLTALVPETRSEPNIVNVWGLTSVERPILWFYTPYNKASEYPADFELLDEKSNSVYKTVVSLPDVPGVIGIPLPATVPPLLGGKQYRWFFNVYCDRKQQQPPIIVDGVVQRVNLSQAIIQELQQAQPRQQAAIYAVHGIWHEALTTLAQLRQKNPKDAALQEEWKELLTSIGLSDIAVQPLD